MGNVDGLVACLLRRGGVHLSKEAVTQLCGLEERDMTHGARRRERECRAHHPTLQFVLGALQGRHAYAARVSSISAILPVWRDAPRPMNIVKRERVCQGFSYIGLLRMCETARRSKVIRR